MGRITSWLQDAAVKIGPILPSPMTNGAEAPLPRFPEQLLLPNMFRTSAGDITRAYQRVLLPYALVPTL
jgi:hypothetical protein